jgi:hypothetical protein
MRDMQDLAMRIREKLARLSAMTEESAKWKQEEWPDASAALSGLTDVERTVEKLHAHGQAQR